LVVDAQLRYSGYRSKHFNEEPPEPNPLASRRRLHIHYVFGLAGRQDHNIMLGSLSGDRVAIEEEDDTAGALAGIDIPCHVGAL
jgi:hypothetical protein